MSLYFFHIKNGCYGGTSNHFEVADRDAAWAELTKVCGDMVGSIARNLKEHGDWQMELLDESRKPMFRIRLVAESFDQGQQHRELQP